MFLFAEIVLDKLVEGMVGALIFGLIGIGLMLFAFKLFDWLLPQVHFQRELCDNKNIAVAIVIGSLLLGVAYLVGQVVR
jgi:hypothetical protein